MVCLFLVSSTAARRARSQDPQRVDCRCGFSPGGASELLAFAAKGPVSVSSRPQAFRVPTNTESSYRRSLDAGETGTSPGLEIGNQNLYSCYWQKTLIPVMKLRWEGQLGPV